MFDRFRASRRQQPAGPASVQNANPTSTAAAGPTSSASPSTSVDGPLREREKPSRFQEAGDLEAGTANSHGLRHGHHNEKLAAGETTAWEDPYGPAPGFKKWWKLYWHDVAAFVFLGAIALWLLLWSPVPYKKYFTITTPPSRGLSEVSGAEVVTPMFAHPKFKQIIPIIPDAMLAVFTPIVVIVLVNLLGVGTHHGPGKRSGRSMLRGTFFFGRGSFWNVNNGCMGVIYSVMTGATIQIIVKLAVPGLRPHFLTVCDPVLPLPPGIGFGGLYYTSDICRDHENRKDLIANAMQSFPSGHSVAAWAGLFYTSLYLNAHLKIFSNYHPSYWKLLLFVTPLIAATIVVGQLSMDMSHNWYDIVTGSLIGVAMAILSYRMCFASVWDFRWNHVPLVRGVDMPTLRYSEEEMVAWAGGAATRRAGWGVAGHGRVGGAPGDVRWGNAHVGMTGASGMGEYHGTMGSTGMGTGYNNGFAHHGAGHSGIGHSGVGHSGVGHSGVGHSGVGQSGVGHTGVAHNPMTTAPTTTGTHAVV